MNDKKLFYSFNMRISLNSRLFLMLIAIASCGKKAKDIPLTEVEKHRMFQDEIGAESLQKQYRLILTENPNSPIAYFLLGRCINNLKEKIRLNEKALELEKDFYYSNVSLGTAYLTKYDSTKLSPYISIAYEYYVQAANSPNKNYLVDYQLSLMYERKGKDESHFYSTLEQKLQYLGKAKKHMLKAKKAKDHEQVDQNHYLSKIDSLSSNISKYENRLRGCRFKESELRTSEIKRLNKFSGILINNVYVNYLGDCKYQVNYSVFDQMYGNWKTSTIKYEWTGYGWNKLTD